MGPPVAVCITRTSFAGSNVAGAGIDCNTLQVGMSADQVTSLLGNHLMGEGMVDQVVTGNDVVETWRFFGPTTRQNSVRLEFTNGFLDTIIQ
jgi:hypothetical protein